MKPEFKEVEYMGGSVRAVTGPDGAIQHITEPGGYFEFLKDAWEDYRKGLDHAGPYRAGLHAFRVPRPAISGDLPGI